MTNLLSIDGEAFDPGLEHFSFGLYKVIRDMGELEKLSRFPRLTSASFPGTQLDDVGLEHVSRVATLENLNLQDTRVTDQGLRALARLPRLEHLRLKENRQLTNACVPWLAALRSLEDLQIHETSIDQQGAQGLAVMTQLRDLCVDVWDDNYTFEGLRDLSSRMPQCRILVKGRGEFQAGAFTGTWTR